MDIPINDSSPQTLVFDDIRAAASLSKEEDALLAVALDSMARRRHYCQYHFDQFRRHSDTKARLFDLIDSTPREPEDTPRIAFESHALAFLSNLHALLDSLPYLLNIIDRVANIDCTKIGWNEKHIDKYQRRTYFGALTDFCNDDRFLQLKGYVNRTKHKHLIGVRNTGRSLLLIGFRYGKKGEERNFPESPLSHFMEACHDELLPKYDALLGKIAIQVERKPSWVAR